MLGAFQPGLGLRRLAKSEQDLSDRLLALRARAALGSASEPSQRLIEQALGREELRLELEGFPVTGECGPGALRMRVGFSKKTTRQGKLSPRALEPGVRAQLFGGQFLFGLRVQLIRRPAIFELAHQVREARKIIPGRIFGHERIELPPRRRIASFLQVDVGLDCSSGGPGDQRRTEPVRRAPDRTTSYEN